MIVQTQPAAFTSIRAFLFFAAILSPASNLNAQTADVALEDAFLLAAFDGLLDQFSCPRLERSPSGNRRIYEQVFESSRVRGSTSILARFSCGALEMDVTLNSRGQLNPGEYPNLSRVELRHSDLSMVLDPSEDVEPGSSGFDAFQENALASAILEALNFASSEGCASHWVVQPSGAAIVRDVSGVPSHEVRTLIDCGALPNDRTCRVFYSFYGRFYPTKSYLFLERVERLVICA